MKNQYFGDVNDYRKYGVLRAPAAQSLTIGVCWLLTADDEGTDGELRKYLDQPSKWRRHDPELYDKLTGLNQPGVLRTVRHCEDWNLVPGSKYFDERVRDDTHSRDDYFVRALAALSHRDVLFFDPDNGIEVSGRPRGRRGSSRYVYWVELRRAFASGSSILVYQHYPRVDRTRFVPFLASRIGEEVGATRVSAFTTSHMVFFLARQEAHAPAVERAESAIGAAWEGRIGVWPGIPQRFNPALHQTAAGATMRGRWGTRNVGPTNEQTKEDPAAVSYFRRSFQ